MRSRSCRISQLMSGSRLPVGSSAMIRRGSWTSARAMAVRCCSPPDSWAGVCFGLGRQADDRQHAVDRRADLAARMAGHLEREGDVLPDRLGRQQLEVLEDDPDLAPHPRDLAARRAGRGPGRRGRRRRGRDLVADEQLDERRLARAGRSDEEDEVALGDDEVDVAQRDLAVGVLLRDVVQDEDGAFLDGLVAATIEDPATERARRRWRWGDGHGRLRGRERWRSADRHRGRFGSTPSAGTARGATSGPRLPPAHRSGKRTGGLPGPRTMVRSGPGSRAVRARSAGSARSRRTAGPSTAGPGTARGGTRPAARRHDARSAVPRSHIANAPRGTTAA